MIKWKKNIKITKYKADIKTSVIAWINKLYSQVCETCN